MDYPVLLGEEHLFLVIDCRCLAVLHRGVMDCPPIDRSLVQQDFLFGGFLKMGDPKVTIGFQYGNDI